MIKDVITIIKLLIFLIIRQFVTLTLSFFVVLLQSLKLSVGYISVIFSEVFYLIFSDVRDFSSGHRGRHVQCRAEGEIIPGPGAAWTD